MLPATDYFKRDLELMAMLAAPYVVRVHMDLPTGDHVVRVADASGLVGEVRTSMRDASVLSEDRQVSRIIEGLRALVSRHEALARIPDEQHKRMRDAALNRRKHLLPPHVREEGHAMTTDPNTDDYAQFVGRMALETQEALAPHFVSASLLGRAAAKITGARSLSMEVVDAISVAWGARSIHAKLLAPIAKARPRFVHCAGCLMPVTPSRSRFAFSQFAQDEKSMAHACQRVRLGVPDPLAYRASDEGQFGWGDVQRGDAVPLSAADAREVRHMRDAEERRLASWTHEAVGD